MKDRPPTTERYLLSPDIAVHYIPLTILEIFDAKQTAQHQKR